MLINIKACPFILLILLSLAGSVYSQAEPGAVFERFDKATRTTHVELKAMGLLSGGKLNFIGGQFSFSGTKLSENACCVTIDFYAIDRSGFRHKKNHNVTFLVDGEPIELGGAQWSEADFNPFNPSPIDLPFIDRVRAEASLDQFQKVAAAKKLKIKIGKATYTLQKLHLKGFAALAERMIAPRAQ